MAASSGKGIGIAVAIAILALLAATVLPAMINAYQQDSTQTYQDVQSGDVVQVTEGLDVTLDTVPGDGTITVTVESTATAESETLANISIGQTKEATVDGYNVSVTNVAIDANSRVTMDVTYPDTFGWDDGAESIFEVLSYLFITIILLTVFGWLVKST